MEITVTAKTYDEAITEALIELHATSDHLEVEVLEKGTEGLFGVIGGKPWVIRAKALTDEELEERDKKAAEPPVAEEPEKVPVKEEIEEEKEVEKAPVAEPSKEPKKEQKKEQKQELKKEKAVKDDAEVAPPSEERRDVVKPVSPEEAEEFRKIAGEFLNSVFGVMSMDVQLESAFNHSENELELILAGEDMGVLIGKRGQTLDSLQYLTSLVVNRHSDAYIRVKLDTENYRERRKAKLEELAGNIARKVAKSRKSVELEPMNPYERRIIHSALQSDPYVTTISEGEEPYRHVVVVLKKGAGNNRRRRK